LSLDREAPSPSTQAVSVGMSSSTPIPKTEEEVLAELIAFQNQAEDEPAIAASDLASRVLMSDNMEQHFEANSNQVQGYDGNPLDCFVMQHIRYWITFMDSVCEFSYLSISSIYSPLI